MRPPAAANDGLGRKLGLRARAATGTCRLCEAQVLPLVPVDGQLHARHAGTGGAQFYCARPGRAARAVRPPPLFPGRAVVGARLLAFCFVLVAAGGGRAGNDFSSKVPHRGMPSGFFLLHIRQITSRAGMCDEKLQKQNGFRKNASPLAI